MSTHLEDDPIDDEFNSLGVNLNNLERVLADADVDYILALSRTGPRFLDLLRESGEFEADCPIITEKALQFIPDEEIEGKSILVFDDIVISGTTVWTSLESLLNNYDDVECWVVTLAVDRETVAEVAFDLEAQEIRVPNEDGTIEPVPWTYFNKIRTSERHEFSKQVSRSLSRLNKPYDMDFALFRTIVSESFVRNLSQQDRVYDVTTTTQAASGLERYTVFLEEMDGFFENIFNADVEKTYLNKVRFYYNRNSRTAMFAPMLIFGVEKTEVLANRPFFSSELGWCNELIEKYWNCCTSNEEPTEEANGDEALAIYRLVWFLASYLCGIYWATNREEDLLGAIRPSDLFKRRDITYLFGDSFDSESNEPFSTHLLDEMEENFEHTKDTLGEIASAGGGDHSNDADRRPPSRDGEIEIPDPEDINRDIGDDHSFDEIIDGVESKLNEGQNMAFKMAIFFQHMFDKIELEAQERISSLGEDDDLDDLRKENERLDTGLTFEELLGTLQANSDFDPHEKDTRRQASAALDILVDKGVQIPQFSDFGSSLGRVYRYGENVPVIQREFKKMMGSVMDHLFNEGTDSQILGTVQVEKIALLLWNRLIEEGHLEGLEGAKGLESNEDPLHVNTGFNVFGKVLNVGPTDSHFTNWADKEGILDEVTDGRFALSPEWASDESARPDQFRNVTFQASDVKVNGEYVKLLYEVQDVLDSSNFDYLIGLTTCSSASDYRNALKTELDFLFGGPPKRDDSSDYSLETVLSGIKSAIESLDDNIASGQAPSELEKCEFQKAAEQIECKSVLWNDLDSIVEKIDDYINDFMRGGGRARNEAKNILSEQLEQIRDRHSPPPRRTDLETLFERTEHLAFIAGHYCRCVEAIESMFTSESESLAIYEDKLVGHVKKYNKSVDSRWDGLTELLAGLDEYEIDSPPNIDIERVRSFLESEEDDTNDTLAEVFEEVMDVKNDLSKIYEEYVDYHDEVMDSVSERRRGDHVEETDYKWIAAVDFKAKNEDDINSAKMKLAEKKIGLDEKLYRWDCLFAEDADSIEREVAEVIRIAEKSDVFADVGIYAIRGMRGLLKHEDGSFISKEPINIAEEVRSKTEDVSSNTGSAPETKNRRFHSVGTTTRLRDELDGVIPGGLHDDAVVIEGDPYKDQSSDIDIVVKEFRRDDRTLDSFASDSRESQ